MEYLEDLLERQKFKCALSGGDLVLDRVGRWNGNASLDRTDSALGYIKGNVLFVTKKLNIAKQSFGYSEFVDMCISVTMNHLCE